jgi:hypothetical protein
MSVATVAPDLDKALNIQVDLFSEFTFNLAFPVNNLADTVNLGFGKVIRLNIRTNAGLSQNLLALGRSNTINIL